MFLNHCSTDIACWQWLWTSKELHLMFMASIQTAANMFDRDEIKALPLSLQHSLIYTITPHTPAMITRWKYILKWIIPHFHKSAFFYKIIIWSSILFSPIVFNIYGIGCSDNGMWKNKKLKDKKFKESNWVGAQSQNILLQSFRR